MNAFRMGLSLHQKKNHFSMRVYSIDNLDFICSLDYVIKNATVLSFSITKSHLVISWSA